MQLPGPVRAAIGLAANVADEARHLPDRAIELPMLAVSTALQMSLRAQQRYAMLTARGDKVLSSGQITDDPPPWATFDDPVEDNAPRRLTGSVDRSADDAGSVDRSADDAGTADAVAILDEIFGGLDDDLPPPTPITSATGSSARQAAAKKSAAKRSAARKTPPAKDETETPDKTEAPESKPGKAVNKPRHTKPSKFDDADG